jgi:SAM-dependent methyltransferase
MDRKKHALKKINLSKGKGLELGPLYSPVVLKSESDVYYIDHMSTGELRKKYEGHPFPIENIVDVDYVVGGTTLKKVVKGELFDYVIASHVIEHIPDMVSWLKDVAAVLKPGGVLSLVIPDKRYSFDVSREVSRPSEVMGAYLDRLGKANSAMIYDSASEYREISPADAWSDSLSLPFEDPTEWYLSEAIRRSELNLKPDEYVDSHCFVFTPYSFFNIVRRLIMHNLFDYEVAYFSDTALNELEFYVSLKKVKIHDRDKQLASLPDIPKPPELRAKELEAQVQLLKSQLELMKNSKSWRITKPLRAINKNIRTKP